MSSKACSSPFQSDNMCMHYELLSEGVVPPVWHIALIAHSDPYKTELEFQVLDTWLCPL